MSVLDDTRYDYISHFGVRGMKWGIRKSTYDRQRRSAAQSKKSASQFREAADQIETGAPGQFVVKGKSGKARRMAADELREQAATDHEYGSKEYKKAIKQARRFEDGALKRTEDAKMFREVAKGFDKHAKSMNASAAKNKVKLDKLQKELQADFESRDDSAAGPGRKIVNTLISGRPDVRPTRGDYLATAAGYAAIGALLYKGSR